MEIVALAKLRKTLVDMGALNRHALLEGPKGQEFRGKYGTYSLSAKIGDGSTASVYSGTHSTNLPVAVKVQTNHILAAREVYALEALRTSQGIVKILDTIEIGDQASLIVMERLYGSQLSDLIGENLTLNEKLRIALSMVIGLESIHGFDIVHRDLKPDNVMVSTIPNQLTLAN